MTNDFSKFDDFILQLSKYLELGTRLAEVCHR